LTRLVRINQLKINILSRLIRLILRNFTEFYLLIVSKTLKLRKINAINWINRLIFSRSIKKINRINRLLIAKFHD